MEIDLNVALQATKGFSVSWVVEAPRGNQVRAVDMFSMIECGQDSDLFDLAPFEEIVII